MIENTFELIKRDGDPVYFSNMSNWIKILIEKAADKVLVEIEAEEVEKMHAAFYRELVMLSEALGRKSFKNAEWRECIKKAMAAYPEICNAFLFAHKEENADLYEQICTQMKELELEGDRSNGNVDSSLVSSKRVLIVDAVEKITYSNYHLTPEQREAYQDGYLYIHDMGHRRDSINCCLFDMGAVLTNGFEMGEMWYDEPNSLSEAFDVIASVSINAAAQIYGGFTIAQIDELLSKYAEKSYVQMATRTVLKVRKEGR